VATLAEPVLAGTSSVSSTGLPARVLGRTGVRISILYLGGWHIGAIKDDNESIRLMQDQLADNTAAVFEYPQALGLVICSALQPAAGRHRAFEILGT
jgi:hypothetical protein